MLNFPTSTLAVRDGVSIPVLSIPKVEIVEEPIPIPSVAPLFAQAALIQPSSLRSQENRAKARLESFENSGCVRTARHLSPEFQLEIKLKLELLLRNRYIYSLGEGASSHVYLLKHEGVNYAVKVLKKVDLPNPTFLRELQISPRIPEHPNVVTSFFTFNITLDGSKESCILGIYRGTSFK